MKRYRISGSDWCDVETPDGDYYLASDVETMKAGAREISSKVGILIAQWAARQAMGIEQDALATVVIRFIKKEVAAIFEEGKS